MTESSSDKLRDLMALVRVLVDIYAAAAAEPGADLVEQLRAARAAEFLSQAEAVDRRCSDPALLAAHQRKLEVDLERAVSHRVGSLIVDPTDPATSKEKLSERERQLIAIRELSAHAVEMIALERRIATWLQASTSIEDLGRARQWWEVVAGGVKVPH